MPEHFSEKLIDRLETETSHVEKFRDGPGKRRNRYWPADFNYTKATAWWKSKAGQHFDKVFSEWCKAEWVPVNYRNMEGAEKGFIKTIMLNGVLCRAARWAYMSGNWHGTYVHPKTKIICYKPKKKSLSYKKKQEQKLAQFCLIFDDYHQIVKMDGIWYDIEISPTYTSSEYRWVDGPTVKIPAVFGKDEYVIKQGPKIHKRFDTITQTRKRVPFEQLDSFNRVGIKRRQLNKAELKQYGIVNDPVQYRGEPI